MPPSTKGRAPIRVAVIGAGRIAQEHLSFLSGATAFGDVSERVAVVAVCDHSRVTAEFAAERYGPTRSYTDSAVMLESERPDVVHVLTEPTSHVPHVKQCLRAGSNVICEKPIAPSRAELDELLCLATTSDLWVMESHNYRFNEPVLTLSSELATGSIGAVTEVEIRINLPITDPREAYADPNLRSPLHRMPAGVIHDFITHIAYLLLHLAPQVEYHTVRTDWNAHSRNALFRFDDLDALLIGEGPSGAVHSRLRFDARSGPDMFRIVVRGTEGYAEAEIFHPNVRVVRPRAGGTRLSPLANQLVDGVGSIRSALGMVGARLHGRGTFDGLHRMLDLTYRALVSGSDLPIGEREMLEASELVDRLLGGGVDR